MKDLSILLKPASSLCNMRCKYCFYADVASNREISSYGTMSNETARKVLESVRSDLVPGDRLTIAFQGGEPTVAGLDFFRNFFAKTDELFAGIELQFAFQTNGLLLNEEWCALFKERRALVGLSMDGNAETHNACRPDAAGKGTYNRIHASLELLKREGIPFNILTVLTRSIARHPKSVWNWLVREGIEYIQFIPCLEDLGAAEPSRYALTPSRLRDFYLGLFPLWKAGMEEGQQVSVKLFDDLINLYLTGRATACGITGRCTVQYIVEANGDVFPCDFYVLDQYRMGSLIESSPSRLCAKGESFLTDGREYTWDEPCVSCKFRASCGGGCKRLRDAMYLENGVCRYAELLNALLGPLLTIARQHIDPNILPH